MLSSVPALTFAMIVKPWQAEVRGYVGPYRPCSSVKYPSLGIAFAAGWVQSFDVETFDMWLLIPIGHSSAKRDVAASRTGGALHSEGCRLADGVMAETVPPVAALGSDELRELLANVGAFGRLGAISPPEWRRRTMHTGVAPHRARQLSNSEI